MSLMAALCVNVLTVNMFLSVFFLSGVSDACHRDKAHLFISAPKEMEALNGSCLQIPCNFTARPGKAQFDNRENIFGVWIKNDSRFGNNPQDVVFNSSRSVNIYNMNITGNMREGSCTTLFSGLTTNQTDKYFFKIENGPFKATAECDPLQINIRDSPWSPKIDISGDLKEKESVTISCSAFTPCPHSPPQLTWNLQQDSHKQIEENTDGTSKIQQSITLSDTHDGFNISCSATYPVDEGKHGKTAETQKTLHVSYAPKETSASISPSGLVSAGSWVNLTCSSRANPPVSSFTWFRNTTDGPMKVAEGRFHSFKMTNMVESYFCEATNILGHQTSSWIHFNSEGNQHFGPVVYTTVKILGIVALYSTIIISECWFRSRCCNKPEKKDPEEADHVNRVIEIRGP